MFHKPIFGRKGASAAKPEEKKRFAPLLGGLFEGSGPQPDLGGLADELRRIDLFGRGLSRKAMRYVATGEQTGFPQDLEGIINKIGRNVWASEYFSDSEAKNKTHLQSAVTLAKGEITDPQVVARFIAVRRAVYPYERSLGRSRPDLPDNELLIREFYTLVAQGDRHLNQHSYHVDPKPPVVSTLSPRAVFRLTIELGGNAATYFKGNTFRSGDLFNRRSHFKEEFTQLIKEHPRDFVEAMHASIDDQVYASYMKLAEELGILTVSHIMAAVFGLLGKGNSKAVREQAIATLARLDLSILPQALKMGLDEGELEMRYDLVQIAGRVAKDEVLEALQEHLPSERSGKVKGAIDAILDTKVAVTTEVEEASESDGAKIIKLANGETYELAPIDESLHAKPNDNERDAFFAFIGLINARRAEQLNDGQERKAHQLEVAQPIRDEEADQLFTVLQAGTRSGAFKPHLRFWDLHKATVTDEMREALAAFSPAMRWRALIILGGTSNFKGLIKREYHDQTIISDLVREEVDGGLDVLALSKLCEDCHPEHGAERSVEYAMRKWLAPHPVSYYPWQNPFEDFPKEAVVRIIAANLAIIDEALGLAASSEVYSLKGTFSVLAMLPALPERYVPKLIELGLTGKREERENAQALLENAQGLGERVAEALDDRRQQVRANAATWLADLRADNAEKAMRKRLKKEKAEVVSAALIEALLRLGADLSDVIGPDALVNESEKKGNKLTLPEWITADTIPQVRFADGNPAPRSLIEYWIGMAVKLKDPGNTGLFGIYLDQLMLEDARTLSGRILQGWIEYDTFGPSLEEANTYAQRQVDATRMRWQQGYYHGNPSGSREDELASLFAYYKREKLNQLPNTGTKSKGILALACRAEPAFAAERVRWFLKKYGRRSHQAMALLDMLAGMNSPTAMQVVIAAATRLKQKSTMAHANAIAERYAKDRGWSYGELADRTVPTAGFDDDGIVDLPCGPEEKPYSARIDASLTVHISNPSGKPIKSLPSGDDEATKESKKALSASKRELKQIVSMQTHRLIEALVAERQWPVDDWLECFHGHPVMRRLIERLVWQGIDEDGDAKGLLRPTQEGDFTNADDEDIDVRAFAHIRLAHAALVERDVADAWRAHLKDYEIKPLIDQFPKDLKPFGGEAEDATAITDRRGWLGESRSYRGIAEKLGYQREMGDGGGTIGYYKNFSGTGLTVVIQTNGGHAVDENVPQALKDLIFRKIGSYHSVTLGEVPPVLLAMCHADLYTIAKKGAYDEQWESKSDW